MKLGVCLPHYGRPLETGRLLEVARRAEARGFDALWVTDHVIVPRDMALIYRDDMLDPLAVLPWLAGVTERIALGASVIILPYRSPVPVAKLLASVDVLSGGRLVFGAAVGWLGEEFEAVGVPMRERASRTDEALELIRTLWTQEYPEVTTARHRLTGVKASPLPLQKPRPPILIGGASEAAFRRVARFGDGWHASSMSPEAFGEAARAVERIWAEAGRPGSPELSVRVPIMVDGIHRAAVDMSLLRGRHAIRGPVERVVEELRAYQALGCRHVALDVSFTTYPAILETLDLLAGEVMPRL